MTGAPAAVAAAQLAPAASAALVTSALYEGWVRHRRFVPRRREFRYRLAMPLLVLDEVDDVLARHPLWSRRRGAPVRVRREDQLFARDRPLDVEVRDLVEERLGFRPAGRIAMLSHLRTLGYLFNPLSAFYCLAGDQVEAQVLAVENTPWHERHAYVVDTRPAAGAPWHASFAKEMHVSPFLPMDVTYGLRATTPGAHLGLRLEDRRGDEVIFDADLSLRRRPLDRAAMTGLLARYPLLPLRVTAAIHLQALRLWAGGVPFRRHPQRPEREDPR